MNLLWLLYGYKSFKNEIKIVLIVLAVLVFLPILSAVTLANAPNQAVSDVLAVFNPVTHKVDIHDANGGVVASIDATTTWPTRGYISQEFGVPNPPYEEHHSGIDIVGNDKEPVVAFMDGIVTKTGQLTEGCGTCVYIDHGNNITSSYSHLSIVSTHEGKLVKAGEIIGTQGKEGWATGVHLHFSIRVYGVLVNPRTFMVGNPSSI